MPNSKEHLESGIALSIADVILSKSNYTNNEIDYRRIIADLILKIPIGMFGSVLADLLEPANNPNHREFFHSISFAIFLLIVYFFVDTSSLDQKLKEIIKLIIIEYWVHLGLDSRTPKGLPIS